MLLNIFCEIDDFCKYFEKEWRKRLLSNGKRTRFKKRTLSMSEVMTIVVWYHRSGYRNFKWYYTNHVGKYLRREFPHLVSYNRFVELMSEVVIPLCAYLESRKGKVTGISYIDSLVISVCNTRRIHSHKVFDGLAQRAKSSIGWF